MGKKVLPEEIQQAEQLLGIRLPDSYKEFLLHINGGVPNATIYNLEDCGGGVIDRFISLNEVVENSIRNRDYLPEIRQANVEIISYTIAAPVVCIGIGQENFGKIYHFEVAMDLVLIADNFIEFIDGLYNW